MRRLKEILALAVTAAVAGCTMDSPAVQQSVQTPMPSVVYTPGQAPLGPAYAAPRGEPAGPAIGAPNSTLSLPGYPEYSTLTPIDPLYDMQNFQLAGTPDTQPSTQPEMATTQDGGVAGGSMSDLNAVPQQALIQPQTAPSNLQPPIPVYPGELAAGPVQYVPQPIYIESPPQVIYEPQYVPVYYPAYAPLYSPFCEPPFYGGLSFNFWYRNDCFPRVAVFGHDRWHDDRSWSGRGGRVWPAVGGFPKPPERPLSPPFVLTPPSAAPTASLARPTVQAPTGVFTGRPINRPLPIRSGPAAVPALPAVGQANTTIVKPATPVVIKPTPDVNKAIVQRPEPPQTPQPASIARTLPRVSNAPTKLPVVTRIQPRDEQPAAPAIVPAAAPKPIVTADVAPRSTEKPLIAARPQAPAPRAVARTENPVVVRSDAPAPAPKAKPVVVERQQAPAAPRPVVRAADPAPRREAAPIVIPRAQPTESRQPVSAPVVRSEARPAPQPVAAAPARGGGGGGGSSALSQDDNRRGGRIGR